MSGAEAIVGFAAAGAGFAGLGIQLFETAQKLDELFHAVNEAPERFRDIHHDLETLAITIENLTLMYSSTENLPAFHTLLDRCVARCRHSVARIVRTVERIGLFMTKHRRAGKVFLSFKDKEIEKLFQDLDRAKVDLNSAVDLFAAARQEVRFVELRERLDVVLHPPSQHSRISEFDDQKSDQNDLSLLIPCKEAKKKTRPGSRFKVVLPTGWRTRRVFDVAFSHISGGFRWGFQTYIVRPKEAPIFQACRDGDRDAVSTLISSGQASFLDVSGHSSETLIEIAGRYLRIDLVEWLLRQDIEWPDYEVTLSRAFCWAVDSLEWNRSCLASAETPESVIHRFLELGVDVDLVTDDPLKFNSHFTSWNSHFVSWNSPFAGYNSPFAGWWLQCPSRCRGTVLRHQPLYFLGLPALHKIWILLDGMTIRFYRDRSSLNYSQVMALAGISDLGQLDSQRTPELIGPFLRKVCGVITIYAYECRWAAAQDWMSLATAVIRSATSVSVDLCLFWEKSQPRSFLRDGVQSILMRAPWSALPFLRLWARGLKAAGVEMLAYGTGEQSLWRNEQDTMNLRYPDPYVPEELIFANEPNDWTFTYREYGSVPVYTLHEIPGTYPVAKRIPKTILWEPMEREKEEGHWSAGRSLQLRSSPRPAEIIAHDFPEHHADVRDDSGPVCLAMSRARRVDASSVQRSRSEPRYVNAAAQYAFSGGRRWVATHRDIHTGRICICPSDQFMFSENHLSTVDLHRCSRLQRTGERRHTGEPQGRTLWITHSFLSEIDHCKGGSYWFLPHRWPSSIVGHTATRDCPHQCSNVNFRKLDDLLIASRHWATKE